MGGNFTTAQIGRVCHRLDLTPGRAHLLLRLYQADGDFVGLDDLLDACAHEFSGPKTITVQICLARKAVGHDAIENLWGRGYRLTETGQARVRRALAA